MTREEVLQRLGEYEAELRDILGRFVRKPDSLFIAPQDRSRLHQLAIELRDLFQDFLGTNTYSSMVTQSYNEGITNMYQSPSYASVERLISIVGAANVRIENNPQLGALHNAEPQAPAPAAALEAPQRVTLKWLIEHVPVSYWAYLAGVVIAAFTLGISAAKLSIVQEWFGIHIHETKR